MNFLTVFILLIAEDTFDGGDVPFFAAGCQDAVLHTIFLVENIDFMLLSNWSIVQIVV